MPVVTRQAASSHNHKAVAAGSILSQAIDVSSLADDYLKFVLYGANRVGKSTLACCFPKPLLLISFEPGVAGGARSVKRVPGVSFIRVTSSTQALQLARELEGDRTYKTHVLDTVTSCQDIVLRELLNLEDAPVQLNWGTVSMDMYRERSEKTREVLRLFRDLLAHTVFVAQEKDHNPPREDRTSKLTRGMQQESFLAADLGSATVKWMHDSCDYIARLYIDKEIRRTIRTYKVAGKDIEREDEEETGRLVRRLRTMYHTNYAAGFRSEDPGVVPEYIEAVKPEEMYAEVMKVISGQKTSKGKYS